MANKKWILCLCQIFILRAHFLVIFINICSPKILTDKQHSFGARFFFLFPFKVELLFDLPFSYHRSFVSLLPVSIAQGIAVRFCRRSRNFAALHLIINLPANSYEFDRWFQRSMNDIIHSEDMKCVFKNQKRKKNIGKCDIKITTLPNRNGSSKAIYQLKEKKREKQIAFSFIETAKNMANDIKLFSTLKRFDGNLKYEK